MELISSVSKTNYSSGRFRIKMQSDGNLAMYPINTTDEAENCYWASDTYGSRLQTSKNNLYLNDTGLQLTSGTYLNTLVKFYTYQPSTVIYRATLDYDGIFRLYLHNLTNSSSSILWNNPYDSCEVKSFCGVNSYCTTHEKLKPHCVCLPGSDFVDLDKKYSGCQRNFTYERCTSGKEIVSYHKMVAKEQLWWKGDYYYRAKTDSKDECSNSCLEDCNCDAAQLKEGYCSKYKYPVLYVEMSQMTSDDFVSFFKTGTISLYSQANTSYNASSLQLPRGVDKEVTTSKKTWVLVLVITIGFSVYAC